MTGARPKARPFWRQPLFYLSLFALLAALLTFFATPLIVVGETQPFAPLDIRLALMLGIAIFWGVGAAIILSRQAAAASTSAVPDAVRRREEETASAKASEHAAVEAEIAAIRHNARVTVARLRKGLPSAFLNPRIYRLPWYLVVGPKGAGKSAMIAASGLEMPYAPETSGSTGTCEFVLTNEAVFVDVAGRLAGAADRSTDRLVWTRLLDLVRRYRPAHPLAGTFLVVGADAQAGHPDETIEAVATALRRRLDEIPKRLRAEPPVYLVVSKLDRLVGFDAFFETLGREERERFLGVPILQEGEAEGPLDPAGRFAQGFSKLVALVSNRQMQRLQDEPDTHRRSLVYEFPNQLAALGTPLAVFVRALTLPNRFERPPLLRGVFLASAVQGGPILDSLAPQLARAYAQTPDRLALRDHVATGGARAFFLPGLFRDVALPEAGAGRSSRRSWYANNRWRAAAAALAALAGLGLTASMLSSYRQGVAHAELVQSDALTLAPQIDAVVPPEPAQMPFATVMAVLDRLALLDAAGQSDENRVILSTEAVGEATDEAYRRTLERLLVPWLQARLAADLLVPDTSSATVFQQLKLYLVLGHARAPESVGFEGMAPLLVGAWLDGQAAPQQVASFGRHLDALRLSGFSAIVTDAVLIETARRAIAEASVARLVYDLAAASPALTSLAPWRPSDAMSPAGPLILARASGTSIHEGVPGLFTRAPFLDIVVPAIEASAGNLAEDAWVLGEEDAARPFADQADRFFDGALELLRADIIRTWDGFLADLSVVPPLDPASGAQLLARLLEPRSPVVELMAAVGAETNLDRPQADPALEAAGTRAVTARLGRTGSALLTRARADADPRGPGAPVTDHFQDVRQATAAPAPDQPSQVASVLRTFDPLYRQLNLAASGGDMSELGTTLQPTVDAITTAIGQLPASLQPFFFRLRDATLNVAVGSSRTRLQEVWATTVLPACRAATSDRFPFAPGARDDTPIGDFAALFSPQGQIAAFREAYLAPYIDASARPWRWREASASDLGFSPDVLRAFEHADAITRAFFPAGDGPLTQFSAEVAALTPNARAVRFDLGGATLAFSHGPSTPLPAQWPPATPGAPAVISILPEIAGGPNMIAGQGPWALFRVLSRAASVRSLGNNVVQATFDLGPRRASVNLTPSTARNPFELGMLDQFRCPRFS